MASIAIVYHSGYGHTQRQAQAIAEGAGPRAQLIAIDAEGNLPQGGWEQLAAADAIVFGSPTYMGGPSWQFKKFADATSKPWYAETWKNKLFAGFTNSASTVGDKTSTLNYFMTLAMQHGGLWVGNGMMPSNTKGATRDDLNWIGVWSGAAAVSPSDASPAEMFAGDLKLARQFGARVAEVASRWAR
ncbi:flavodoxin family protein [Ramlibacter sp. AN1015]|uniref:flavodoxin family protein n=1 Tax=Ramlibacter sp. AN1015 TaxID=3133428 RepID=UPI0030C59553